MIGFKTFMAKIREVLMEHPDIKTTRRCFLNKALNKNQLWCFAVRQSRVVHYHK